MSEKEQNYLHSIVSHIEIIEDRFTKIKTPDDFKINEQGGILLDAITIRLQALADNVKSLYKISPELFINHTEVEWDKIIRFRDLISHHYELLDNEMIFQMCSIDVPVLKTAILSIMKSSQTK